MKTLRQGNNQLQIVGTLQSKKVNSGINSDGYKTLSIELKIVSSEFGKINENTVRLWSKEGSKLFKGHQMVAKEFKTVEEHGIEHADKVMINGTLEMNEYVSKKDGELKTINSLKGVFASRLTESENQKISDEVGAYVECVIAGYSDEIKDGIPTGRKKVILYNVGYQNSINEFQKVYVEKENADDFVKIYPVNSTAKLCIKVNNYVETKENESQPEQKLGFGTMLNNMPDKIVKNYVNELIIVGGDMPELINKYSDEEIAEMKKLLQLTREEKLSVPAQPTQPSGFGNGFGSGFDTTNSIIDDADMPF